MIERIDAAYQRVLHHGATPVPARFALKTIAILVRELNRDQVLVRAATLAYWSLVAIVPALVVAAAVTQPLGPEAGRPIRELLFSALLAGAVANVGATLDGWLEQVNVASLGVVGTVGVAFTASRIYFSVEEAYNTLWNVRLRRGFVMRLVLFYAGLSLVPILIAVGFAVTGRIQDAVDTSILSLLLPVLLTSIAFVAAIRLLPDTDVRWGPAMLGGLASAILFEGAKVGFNTYVSVLGADDAASAIYGSLALFPIFLLWLYVLWVIVLFGVELAFVTQRHGELFAAEERRLLGLPYARRHADALFALQCLLVVARRFVGGEGPVSESFVTRALGTEPTFVRNALESLEDAGILAQAPLGYLPALPLDRLTLRDVILRYRALTRPALVDDAPGTEVVAAVIGGPGAVLDATVAQMLEKPPGAGAAAVEAAG